MPRTARFDAPGVVHHVTLRGVGRRDLFLDDEDRERFLGRLGLLVGELGFSCLAWALMSNHAHLVLRSRRVRLPRLMSRLGTAYALYFARRHGWAGHVLQNRYGSSRVGDDAYLAAAIAYVHRNPVEAGLVEIVGLPAYPWTSHGALVGARPARPFEACREALAAFDGGVPALVAAVARGAPVPSDLQWRKLPPPTRRRRAPSRRAASFEAILVEEATRAGLAIGALLSRTRLPAVAAARGRVADRAVRELGWSLAQAARRLGVTPGAVTRMLDRIRSA